MGYKSKIPLYSWNVLKLKKQISVFQKIFFLIYIYLLAQENAEKNILILVSLQFFSFTARIDIFHAPKAIFSGTIKKKNHRNPTSPKVGVHSRTKVFSLGGLGRPQPG